MQNQESRGLSLSIRSNSGFAILQASLILASLAYMIHWAAESVVSSMKAAQNTGLNVAITRDDVTMSNMASYAPICSRSFDFSSSFPKLAQGSSGSGTPVNKVDVRILNPYSTTAVTGTEVLAETGLQKIEGYRYEEVSMRPVTTAGGFVPFIDGGAAWDTDKGELTYDGSGNYMLNGSVLAENQPLQILDSGTGSIVENIALSGQVLYRTGGVGNNYPDFSLAPYAVPKGLDVTFALPVELFIKTQATRQVVGVSANRQREWTLTLQVQAQASGDVVVLGCFDPAQNVANRTCLRVGGRPTSTSCDMTPFLDRLVDKVCRINGGYVDRVSSPGTSTCLRRV